MEKRFDALLRAANAICSSMQLSEILDILVEQVLAILDQTDVIFIMLYDEEIGGLRMYRSYGTEPEAARRIVLRPGEANSGHAFATRKAFLRQNMQTAQQGMVNISKDNFEDYQKAVHYLGYARSSISVPMLYRDDCIGVMTIDRFFAEEPYTIGDLHAMETIASLAAVAIANARLFQQTEDNLNKMHQLNEEIRSAHDKLNQSVEINRLLAIETLKDQGMMKTCQMLARTLQMEVLVLDAYMEVLAASHCFPLDTHAQIQQEILRMQQEGSRPEGLYIVPISDGTLTFGYIVIPLSGGAQTDLVRHVCDMAALLFALEIIKAERERQFKEELIGQNLNDLISGHRDEALLTRLKRISPHIASSKLAIAIVQCEVNSPQELLSMGGLKHCQRMLLHELKQQFPSCIYMIRDASIVVLYPFPVRVSDQQAYTYIEGINHSVLETLAQRQAGVQIFVGCGQLVSSFDELPHSLADARLAVQYAQATGHPGKFLLYHQLGLRKLLFRHTPEELLRFCQDTLGPIMRYDEQNRTELLVTLRAYKAAGQSAQRAAQRLNVHKNTLNYRLRKVRELLHMESDEDARWYDVLMALEAQAYMSDVERQLGGV